MCRTGIVHPCISCLPQSLLPYLSTTLHLPIDCNLLGWGLHFPQYWAPVSVQWAERDLCLPWICYSVVECDQDDVHLWNNCLSPLFSGHFHSWGLFSLAATIKVLPKTYRSTACPFTSAVCVYLFLGALHWWKPLWSCWPILLDQIYGWNLQTCWHKRPNDLLWPLWNAWSNWICCICNLVNCILQTGSIFERGSLSTSTNINCADLSICIHTCSNISAWRSIVHWFEWTSHWLGKQLFTMANILLC